MSPSRLRYGDQRGQTADLWRPASSKNPVPVVVLIHGGYWQAPYTKRLMRHLAAAVIRQGWAALNIEYRRLGLLGGGGGWPETFADVAAAIDHLETVDGVDLGRVVTCGHSAGGHLALWAAGRSRLPPGAPGAQVRVRVAGAAALAGVVDLVEAERLGLGGGAVARLMGGTAEERAAEYALGSPAALVPLGVPQVLIHGLDDRTVPSALSERYTQHAVGAGDDASYVALSGADHMALIRARGPAWDQTRSTLEHLVRRD